MFLVCEKLNMAIVKIKGGLGNQMFQYAHGRKLELKGKKVVFDISFFHGAKANSDTPREFNLSAFNIATQAEFSPRPRRLRDLLTKIAGKIGVRIEQYFQGEKYFQEISGELRKEFTLKNGLSPVAREILKQIENPNSVSLHVRRGDYVNDKKIKDNRNICGLEYYRQAMARIQEKVNNAKFFVFSDEIDWAKENFIGEEFVFVSSPELKEYEEMILMSRSAHHIIANSSFSWWGAWLGQNNNKIVIAPSRWLLDSRVDTSDIIPKDWIKI
jgi:hypothetical protein